MSVPRPYFPGREFVLHPKDIDAWDALLHESFPQIRYYDDPSSAPLPDGQGPPDIRLRTTLFGKPEFSISLVLDPAWRPVWSSEPTTLQRTRWHLTPAPHPNATILLGGEVRDEPRIWKDPGTFVHRQPDRLYPPCISGGRVYFRCDKDKPEHMRIAQKALRLIAKVATNKALWVHYPSMRAQPMEKGGLVWCGFHALDWCRKAPDRFLGYVPSKEGDQGYGCRPLD